MLSATSTPSVAASSPWKISTPASKKSRPLCHSANCLATPRRCVAPPRAAPAPAWSSLTTLTCRTTSPKRSLPKTPNNGILSRNKQQEVGMPERDGDLPAGRILDSREYGIYCDGQVEVLATPRIVTDEERTTVVYAVEFVPPEVQQRTGHTATADAGYVVSGPVKVQIPLIPKSPKTPYMTVDAT